jgi:hypothetical protein
MEREGIMRADENFHGGITMEKNRFAVAGWMSIILAILTLPGSFMHLMIDIKHIRWVLPFSVGFDIILLGITIYVLVKIRDWLNVTYDFHDLDSIIPMIIVGNIVVMPLAAAARVYDFGESYFYLIPIYGILAGLSILMIIFSARFLRVDGKMRGLKKPIAYIGITIAICFLTFILIPLGMVLGMAYNLLIGLAMLQSPQEEVDYV